MYNYFFNFSIFWFSRLSQGWNGKKWLKMTKNFGCLTLYLIWLRFLVHTCKMVIYLAKFIIFSKLQFFGFEGSGGGGGGGGGGVKGQEWPKSTYFSQLCSITQDNSRTVDFWCTGGKWWYLQVFFYIFLEKIKHCKC